MDNGIKIYYKNKDEYTIKTTIGNFNDVNEVIKKYPNVKESKKIGKCNMCGKYFIKMVNNQKTCSKSCSIENRRYLNRKNQDKQKLFIKHQNQNIIAEYKKNKGLLPAGFNQIDTNKTIGEVLLWEGIPKKPNGEYDWEKEQRIVKKLQRDLYKNNIVND